jgi:hypothetical protein
MLRNKKLFWSIILALILILMPISQIQAANNIPKGIKIFPIDSEEPPEGVRWDMDEVTVIYINGTFYEMGYQLGKLMTEEITINHRAFKNYYDSEGFNFNFLCELWDVQKEYVSEETIDYIQGCADAMDLSFEDVACIWVAEGAAYSNKCSSIAAWGDATKDGKLIFSRSLEFPIGIKDPLTGSYVQDFPVIVIADPDDYNAFVYPTFAGYVVEDGMNDKGIAISNMWSPNNDQTINGSPMGIRIFEALFSASTADDAIRILTTHKTFGYNFIVADSKNPIGYAVETTANNEYTGTWNDPSENQKPFWSIKDVVRRTNCFLNQDTQQTQRDHYNPRHYQYWLEMAPWIVIFNHYKAISKGVQRNYGDLTVDSTMQIMRNAYHGQYDLIWRLILARGASWSTWWQWVACPETGDMQIAFADGEISAHSNDYIFEINFLKTIENQIPS